MNTCLLPIIIVLMLHPKDRSSLLTPHCSPRNDIGKVTGGVGASLEVMSVKPTGWDDDVKVLPGVNMLTILTVHGKCTSDKAKELFSIFTKILTEINIEDSKSILVNSLKSSLSSKKTSVASRGHSYASRRIRARYSGNMVLISSG